MDSYSLCIDEVIPIPNVLVAFPEPRHSPLRRGSPIWRLEGGRPNR
jgi:hypothetical protein